MMKKIRAIFLCAFTSGAWLSTNAAAVDVGQPAPLFALPTAAGDTVGLERLRGKVVYVDFWASWCGPCRRSFPWMNEMQRRYGSHGLSIVAINVDKKRADKEKDAKDYTLSDLFGKVDYLPKNSFVTVGPLATAVDAKTLMEKVVFVRQLNAEAVKLLNDLVAKVENSTDIPSDFVDALEDFQKKRFVSMETALNDTPPPA